MVTSTTNFGELLEPGLAEIYGQTYERFQMMHSSIFEMRTSTRAFEESLSIGSFGTLPVKDQGTSVTYADPKQNWKDVLTNETRGLGFVVTREMHEDDQYQKIVNYTRSLADSVAETIEINAANVLNNGFDSSVRTGGDGLELLSDAHLLGEGGTWRNELSSAADLSTTSLEQALIDIGDMVDDAGKKMHARAETLIVPNELAWTASKLLDSTQEPDTANNAVNPGHGIMPFKVWNYLTDEDAWFIKTNIRGGLVHYTRRAPDFTRDNDFDTENAKFKATYRAIDGWDDPRGVFGSPGA